MAACRHAPRSARSRTDGCRRLRPFHRNGRSAARRSARPDTWPECWFAARAMTEPAHRAPAVGPLARSASPASAERAFRAWPAARHSTPAARNGGRAMFSAEANAAPRSGSASVRRGRSLNTPSRSDGAFGGSRPRRIPTSKVLRNSLCHRAGTNASPRRKRIGARSELGAVSSSNGHEAATDAPRTKTLNNDGPRGAP